VAVKIRLKRLGKIRVPQYRIVVVDARKKRDGRVIEEIGKYHPKEEPSYIEVVSERAQYWLGVGAQPSEPVAALLKVTGDWQRFKGLPGGEGTLRSADAKRSKLDIFNEALAEANKEPKAEAVTKRAAKKAAPAAEPAAPVAPAAPAAETPAAETPAANEVPADETPEGATAAAATGADATEVEAPSTSSDEATSTEDKG
jgi:small subunit ribosomal protein S16